MTRAAAAIAAAVVAAALLGQPGTALAGGNAETTTLALVVTNNRSFALGRPDLQYADDDGAKYYELFRALSPGGHIELLSELDADTARLFPDAVAAAHAPTRDNVRAAAARLEQHAKAARAAGRTVDLYFVFAGHGDVDQGRGFLELADGPLTSDDLDRVLATVGADRSHVILDSCNSFFVINPRKPGGRRFATAGEAGRELADRRPSVGVFLSTSAEADVFEWSELQSGIFSHAVRSGLSGAADADADGAVSYAELEAFVTLAAQNVRNPLFRPRIFARAPGGEGKAALVRLPPAARASLVLDGERAVRVSVRDRDELRWIDTHKEAGARAVLHLPPRVAAAITVDELDPAGTGNRRKRYRAEATGDGPVLLSALSPAPARGSRRGPSELLRMLFSEPYGPRAVAAYERSRGERVEPIYGIAFEDIERMELLLDNTAGLDRQWRFAKAAGLLGAAGVTALAGIYVHRTADEAKFADATTQRRASWVFAGSAAVLTAAGVFVAARSSHGELAYSRFRRDLADEDTPPSLAVANAERRLLKLKTEERNLRRLGEFLAWTNAGSSTLAMVGNEFFGPERYRNEIRLILGTSVVASAGIAMILRTNITPVERMVNIWHADPGIRRLPRMSIGPTRGGALLHFAGEF